jgi:hypothetical protein
MRIRNVAITALALVVITWMGCGGDGETKPDNKAPVITDLRASADTVGPFGHAVITCSATDADGDSLRFAWQAGAGIVSGGDAQPTFFAPEDDGSYTITCTVTDGNGGADAATVDVEVAWQRVPVGRLELDSDPAAAAISLNGFATSYATPHDFEHIAVGTHTVALFKDTYTNCEDGEVEVFQDQTTSRSFTMCLPAGGEPLPRDVYENLPVATPTGSLANLPVQVDLSACFPAPGDQGRQASCAAWAAAYVKTYHECDERGWSLGDNSHVMSPAYIYNQLVTLAGNCTKTLYLDQALELVKNQGCASLAKMPYVSNACSAQPSSSAREEAKQYRFGNWSRINERSVQEIKGFLANDRLPVILGCVVHRDLQELSPANPIFDDTSQPTDLYHFIALVGYDDGMAAFKFINSVGTGWGLAGYGWIAYSLIGTSVVPEAYVAFDTSHCDDFPPPPGEICTYRIQGTPYTYSTVTQAVGEEVGGYEVYRIWTTDNPESLGMYVGCDDRHGEVDVATDWWDFYNPSVSGRSFWEPPVFYCDYGDEVGTTSIWIGTFDGDPEQQVMEVLKYEDLTVPYGAFQDVMKARITSYADYEEYDDFFVWIHPQAGILKGEDAVTGDVIVLVDYRPPSGASLNRSAVWSPKQVRIMGRCAK